MTHPPTWTEAELTAELAKSVDLFRKERIEEDVTDYGVYFDQFMGHFETLIETTVDLSQLEEKALEILSDSDMARSFRYLAGPPISADDLETIAEAVLTPSRLKNDQEMVGRIVQVIQAGLDRRRFPWVKEGREPEEAERQAAVIASAALMASQTIGTKRRNEGSNNQQDAVRDALLTVLEMKQVPAKDMAVLRAAPNPGEFCLEAKLSERKADLTVGLFDNRVMPIECKVSNSKVNSVKRLNNDAAVKAEAWKTDLGAKNVVPVAVLSGVYSVANMRDAQSRGLTLFWAHDLKPLIDFVNSTKPVAKSGKKPRR